MEVQERCNPLGGDELWQGAWAEEGPSTPLPVTPSSLLRHCHPRLMLWSPLPSSLLFMLTLVLSLASEMPIRGLQSLREEILALRVNRLRLVNAKLRSPAQTD